MIITNFIKIFIPALVSFFIGILLTPIITHYLYKYKMWKKKAGKISMDGRDTPIFNELHKNKEVGTPKMGGIIIWLSAFITIAIIWSISKIFPNGSTAKLDFLSRSQTWIPLFTLMMGALVGLIDDFFDIRGVKDNASGGLSFKKRIFIVAFIGLLCSLWFYFKLGVTSIGVPFANDIEIGWLFIPFFVIVTIAIYAGGIIDGIDGLAGGIFSTIFTAYAIIAFSQQQIDLAAFCAVIVGGLLAFLWFNIPPARFYMSETGSMALTITLTVVAFMTDSLAIKNNLEGTTRGGYGVLALPIIAFPLVFTVLSNVIQVTSKKFRNGKKVFRVAPIHHHFEALGWPAYKVTMRYWIIGLVFAILGTIAALIG